MPAKAGDAPCDAVIASFESVPFDKLVEGLPLNAHQHGFRVVLASSHRRPSRGAGEVRALIERVIDAMMLIGCSRRPEGYELFRAQGVPFVNTSHHDPSGPVPRLGLVNAASAQRMRRIP